MKPLPPYKLRQLEDALKALDRHDRENASTDAEKIEHLKVHFGAKATQQSDGYVLVCAGVRASCTWSRDYGLLNAWQRLARRRIWQAQQAADDREATHA